MVFRMILTRFYHVLLGLLLTVSWTRRYSYAASFYGSSHISLPLQDARSTTDIYFRLRTHRADAMLFLAAGPIDYCLVILEGGEIKVRINLGAGEAILTSQAGLRLDDLLWHEVEVHRKDAELSLTIDGLHSTYLDIPGRFFELNIKFGVFVGGLGGFDELFLGNLRNYRGCLEDLSFNDLNIFSLATESIDKQTIRGVTWDCSEEFEASSHHPISFVDRGAYMALPSWNARTGGSLSFHLKTLSTLAVVFYQSGTPSQSDFLAVEILSSKISLSVNDGNGVVVLESDIPVSDGYWHHVAINFSPTYVEVSVDGQAKNLRPSPGENRFYDLAGYLYVAGIELNKQSRALQQGVQSVLSEGMDSSFRGCIKNIKVNNQVMGLREAEVTQGIKADCVWEYPCLQEPCIIGAECFQEGLDGFRCMCDEPVCVRTNFTDSYKLYTKSSLPIDLEMLTLRPLEVPEGGTGLITTEHIQVILDYQKFGVRESGVLFHIIEPPKHGTLEVEIWKKIADNIFTLLDLGTDKVRYTHDGSEVHQENIVFDLEFRARSYRLPSFLEQKQRFIFPIRITPVNDPPKLKLLPGKIMMAKNTKRILTSDLLSAEDPDNDPTNLQYTVLTLGAENEGYVEHVKNPGTPIETFSQDDVNNRLISYVHRGSPNARLALRVSDGIETGQTAVLRISTFDLQVTLVNNTGIVLPYNSFVIITPDNLTFTTNAQEQSLEIKYDVTKLPLYGSLQRLRGNGRWQSINHFTQRQLNREKIRYSHTTGRPAHDEFKFLVSCADLKVPTLYDFRITFIDIDLRQVMNKELLLDKVLEQAITEQELKFETYPLQTPLEHITYTMLSLPEVGTVYLNHGSGQEQKRRKLEIGSTFTQRDINSRRLHYRLHRRSYSAVFDSFSFKVSTPSGVVSDALIFRVRHVPSVTNTVITIEKLNVVEGGQATISQSHLHIQTEDARDIVFNITSQPKHGILRLLNGALTETEVESPETVSTEEIASNRLVYVHDDSEHQSDGFHFVTHGKDSEGDFVYYGVFPIKVMMKNDNPPIRAIEKAFHVVQNGERKLTGKDLKYVDVDIDSTPQSIQYTRRGIPNGALFHISNPDVEVFRFTQEDLDKGNIMFKHNGEEYGRAVLWITDGQFYATGILEIQASKPFVKISKNTGLVVRRGESEFLTSANMSVETNVNVDPEGIIYKIVSRPKHGDLFLNGKEVNQFTQKDIDNENVEYENDNSLSFTDSFEFVVVVDQVNADGIFEFKIYPESYWQPLSILHNRTLYVDEGKGVMIGPTSLQIAHVNINPSNITYIIKSLPRFGQLKLGDDPSKYEKGQKDDKQVKTFTQADINDGKLHYIQLGRNVSEDFFTFDVTNGISTLKNLKFSFNVISNIILLRTGNISTLEGREVRLTDDDIGVANSYFSDWVSEYLVVEQPQHGYITNSKLHPGKKLIKFEQSQLKDGVIQYVHDGSESLRDWFTVVAKAAGLNKESAPSTVHVTVEPVNDEAPHVINNTGLEVWEGSTVTFTSQHLSAADDDSIADDINFVILMPPSNGYMAFKNDTKTPILHFTQDHINMGFVVFVHTGDTTGGFRFQVNDGINYDSPHIFTITARKLKLILEVNQKLTVLPRMQQSITRSHLLTVTNDAEPTREIVYQITEGPMLGRVLLENPDGSVVMVTRFTQKQIDKNLVLYEQTEPMPGLKATDTITFDIETAHAETLRHVTFNIDISLVNVAPGNIDQLIHLKALRVREGAKADITQEHIDVTELLGLWENKSSKNISAKLIIQVHSYPEHGWILLDGGNITDGDSLHFTRDDIRQNRLSYQHDDSETMRDEIPLGFYIATGKDYPDISLYNGTLDITVIPVNDRPFELMTKEPKLEVVQGQKVLITIENLNTVDEDGIAQDIVYEIVDDVKNGYLAMVYNDSFPLQKFTQYEINRNLLCFVHDGSREQGVFHFRVSDGLHKPVYAPFNINVIPLSLEMTNRTTLHILQGSRGALLQSKHLGAITNGNRDDIMYNVTCQPQHGKILLNDNIASIFRQTDVDQGFVAYMQLDWKASNDSFTLNIWNPGNLIENEVIQIEAVPLVKQGVFNVPSGSEVLLTVAALDASKLAEQTSSDPVYTIITKPKYGYFKRLRSYRKRETIDPNEVSNFTHQDIVHERISYVSQHVDGIEDELIDTAEYLLTAKNAQPARGIFTITMKPPVTTITYEWVPPFHTSPPEGDPSVTAPSVFPSYVVPTKKTDGDGSLSPSRGGFLPTDFIQDNYLYIAGGAALLLLVILIIIIVRCRSGRTKDRPQKPSKEKKSGKSKERGSDRLPSNGSLSLSDELPPPAPPTSPSSTGSRSECTTPGRTYDSKDSSKGPDLDLSLPPPPCPPYLTDDSEWTEVSSTVPTCKVTPLNHVDQPDVNETTLKPSFGVRDPSEVSDVDEWQQFEVGDIRYGPTGNPMLRKNQYWV